MAEHPNMPTGMEKDITHFDSSKLKHAEVQEKNVLPSPDGLSNFNQSFRIY